MKKHRILPLLTALLLLLPSCGWEGWERVADNQRIYARARREAKALAEAYIKEKYGLEVTALGYDVDGSDIFMAYRAHSLATVALTDGEGEFLVYLSLEDPDLRWDNYQREEVAACLTGHLHAALGLEAPYVTDLIFQAAGDPSPGQAQINGKTYSVECMLNFLYEGQSAPELLEELKGVEYAAGWLGEGPSLEELTLPAEAWPAGVELEVSLRRYRDRESFDCYGPTRWTAGGSETSVRQNPALLETAYLTLDGGKATRQYARYERVEAQGLVFVGRAMVEGAPGEVPIPPEGWVADGLTFPAEPIYWAGRYDRAYAQAGPLFCCVCPQTPEGVECAISCTVPPAFFDAHGAPLFYGFYTPKDMTQELRTSLPLRPGRPGTYEEGNVYIRQTLWVTSTAEDPVWYAFLREVG